MCIFAKLLLVWDKKKDEKERVHSLYHLSNDLFSTPFTIFRMKYLCNFSFI